MLGLSFSYFSTTNNGLSDMLIGGFPTLDGKYIPLDQTTGGRS